MEHGHPEARRYPIGMLWDETRLVIERANQEEASRSALLQMAIGSVLSKDGAKLFKKTLKDLIDG